MDRPLSILIVEDDPVEREALADCMAGYQELRVVGTTDNEWDAFNLVKACLPDAMVLDLELGHGKGGGIDLLRRMKESGPAIPHPYILVTTENSSAFTGGIARDYGADYIQSKGQIDYSPEFVADFLLTAKSSIQSRTSARTARAAESPNTRQKRLAARISAELDKLGVSPKLLGRRYLEMGIRIMIQDPSPRVCAAIAREVGKTEPSVERAIKNAIDRTWAGSSDEELSNYTARIDPERGLPTVTEFIYHYADKLRRENEI